MENEVRTNINGDGSTCSVDSACTETERMLDDPINEAHDRLKKAQSRYVTVEVPVGLATLTYLMLSTLEAEYLRERVVASHNVSLVHNNSLSSCDVGNDSALIEDEIQSQTSLWLLYLGIAKSLPSIITAIFFGSLSDRLGRKPALALSIVGMCCQSLVYLTIVYLDLPLYAFIAGDFIAGACGGLALLLASSAAYITDVTSEKSRTIRIIVLETVFFIGSGIGQIALGYALKLSKSQSLLKYMPPLWLAVASTVVALLYIATPNFIIETVDRRKAKGGSGVATVIRGFIDLIKTNTNGRRSKIIVYNLVMVCAVISAQSASQLTVVYSLGDPFCFTPIMVSLLQVVGLVMPALGMIIGGPVLPRIFTDNYIMQFSIWNSALAFLVIGLATDVLMIFIGRGLGILNGIGFPIIRSQLSKVSADHERGLMLALVGCMDSAASLITPLVSNSIYSATVFFYPPLVFFFLAAFQLIPSLMVGILQYIERRGRAYKPLDNVLDTGPIRDDIQ